MNLSPVTIGYEYECPRFGYELDVDGETETVEANFCLRRGDRVVCVAAADIAPSGTGVDLRFETVFDRDAAAVAGFEADRLGTTVLQVQVIRRPSVIDRLAAWRWPPTIDDCPFEPVPEADDLLHPTADRPRCAGEVLHSLEANERRRSTE
jgi:hypothetical protein